MKKVFVYFNGCMLRSLDANRICNYLSKNGYQIIAKPNDADIIIFIGCSVISELTEKSLSKINEFQKYNAELIVAGCTPEIDKEKLSEIFSGRTIATKDLDKIDEFFPENKIKFCGIDDSNTKYINSNEEKIVKIFGKTKLIKVYKKIELNILKKFIDKNSSFYQDLTKSPLFYVRVSRGCLGNCSYCSIKKAVGPFKSKPSDQCIAEFKKGLDKGHKFFSVAADDTGAYGLDINTNFPKLLDKLTNISGDYKISITFLNPRWAVKYIDDLEEIVRRGKIIRMGIPIQSGSSRVLKLMHRYSDVDKMKDAFLRLKKSYPKLSLFTDCIVGFPTETEDDFNKTLLFLGEISFNDIYIARFSCKVGTEAEKIEPKISDEEISRRFRYAKKYLKKQGYVVFNTSKTQSAAIKKLN